MIVFSEMADRSTKSFPLANFGLYHFNAAAALVIKEDPDAAPEVDSP
jgi:hypothetical protein